MYLFHVKGMLVLYFWKWWSNFVAHVIFCSCAAMSLSLVDRINAHRNRVLINYMFWREIVIMINDLYNRYGDQWTFFFHTVKFKSITRITIRRWINSYIVPYCNRTSKNYGVGHFFQRPPYGVEHWKCRLPCKKYPQCVQLVMKTDTSRPSCNLQHHATMPYFILASYKCLNKIQQTESMNHFFWSIFLFPQAWSDCLVNITLEGFKSRCSTRLEWTWAQRDHLAHWP